jgi:hypothetical protein
VVLKRCWLARYWGLAVQYGNIILKIILVSNSLNNIIEMNIMNL